MGGRSPTSTRRSFLPAVSVPTTTMIWLHRYTRLLAVLSLVLITAGGLVTSTDSGLAVPDWPNTYGYFMFSFPLSKMVGGIFYEHGHRLIASIVGMLTIVLAIWLSRVDARRWIRRLGWIALAAVITQGLLGGMTVLFFLPAPISISHAGLAQLFFALIVSLGVFTSKGWRARYQRDKADEQTIDDDALLGRLVLAVPILVYLQILVGATMRHTGAGLAIPDFPWAFGQLIPPVWDRLIAVHYAHRVGAVVVTLAILATVGHVWAHHPARRELIRPAWLLTALVVIQFSLGAWTVLSERAVAINTAHVATGALLFVTTVVLALRTHRARFVDDARLVPAERARAASAPSRAIAAPGSPGTAQ